MADGQFINEVGAAGEEFAANILKHRMDPDPSATVDCLDGTEIKTAREWVGAPGSNGKRRRGRFRIKQQQIRFADRFLFIVVDEGLTVLRFAYVDADEVADKTYSDRLHPARIGL